MLIDPITRGLLASADPRERRRGVERVLEVARRERTHASELLSEAAQALEALPDWPLVLALTEEASVFDLPDGAFAEWLARKAWCLFWLNRADEAQEVLANVRDLAERHGTPAVRLRVYLISGYVMDVRGAHAQALAWYTKALTVADDAMRPHVLVEVGTSYSKQGALAEALARFEEALALLRPGDTAHEHLRVHLLSRSAVAYELLSDFTEALRRHDAALAVARTLRSHELEFTCLSRRFRTELACRDFPAARADLAAMEALAPKARRGMLHVTHDRARLHRAEGAWPEALAAYRGCVAMLPEAPAIVSTYSDIWSEILDGVEVCLVRLRAPGADAVREAQSDLATVRERSDIYSGQAVALEERRARAAASTERVREMLRAHERRSFVAAGYRFDLDACTAVKVGQGGPGVEKRLDAMECLLLAFLHGAPGRAASTNAIKKYFQAHGHPSLTPDALRQMVSRLKKKLALGRHELLTGKRGELGGGYTLLVNEP